MISLSAHVVGCVYTTEVLYAFCELYLSMKDTLELEHAQLQGGSAINQNFLFSCLEDKQERFELIDSSGSEVILLYSC